MSTHISPEPEWRLKKFQPEELEPLAGCGLSSSFQKVLCSQGINNQKQAEAYLNPSLDAWTQLDHFPSLEREAKNVWTIVQEHQPVCVHGDFDSDGLCATMVLSSCLEVLGISCFTHLPSRRDGHGVSCASLRSVAERGAKSVITVDCGISAFEEAELAKSLGIQFVVTDHHLAGEALPAAAAIINPQLDEDEAHQNLCGAGVALKLALACSDLAEPGLTRSERYRQFFRHAVVLTAIATVADLMPLTGNNRALVRQALTVQPAVTLPGLRRLLDHLKLNENSRSEDWAFQLIPRLNSAQRMERSELLRELFDCDEEGAAEVVAQLDGLNQERRKRQAQCCEEALAQVRPGADEALVWVQGSSWSEGFSGLIANHMVKQFGKPAVVLVESEDELHASLRCPAGFHLKAALDEVSGSLIQYGGHAQAAGFKALAKLGPVLRQGLSKAFEQQNLSSGHPKLMIIDHLPFSQLKLSLFEEQERLEPFGKDNPKPTFATKGLLFDGSPRLIGADRTHVSFRVFIPGHPSVECIGFGLASSVTALDQHGRVDLAYQLGKSPYNGQLQLSIQSIRQHQTKVMHRG
jgi:single-stranded-DNA-specific exonuclease